MSRIYSLTTENGRKSVCQKFFLSTLDIDEKRIRTALKTRDRETGTVGSDNRGCHENHYNIKEREETVIAHISKFKTVESHYVRKTATAQYLPTELTIKAMYRMYVEEAKEDRVESYDVYKRVFNEKFNLKFHKNKKDKCDRCETMKNMPAEAKTDEMIIEHDKHIEEKKNAREFKEEMKKEGEKSNVIAAAFDLEKVLLCPHGPTSSFYYSKRLKLHNFTITDIESMMTECFVWHEGEAAKGSSEIGTCLQMFLRRKKVDTVHFFSDRCGGQNMNRMVMVALHEIFMQTNLKTLSMNFKWSFSKRE